MVLFLLVFLSCTIAMSSAGCQKGEFECKFSHACIPEHQKCNGVPECPHAEDEHGCPLRCSTDEFPCDHLCLSTMFFCDGHYDCTDQSDEAFCPQIRASNHTCRPDHFMCTEGTCIPLAFVCDGHKDCLDDLDEKNCDVQAEELDRDCPAPNYKCKDVEETCIAQRYICDGAEDCSDGSDEHDCGDLLHHHECLASEGMFACNKSSVYDQHIRCIPSDQVCNGKPQCPNGEDEGQICSEKQCPARGCEHQCMETGEGPRCFCNSGYILSSDGKSCEDVNECKTYGTCSQFCTNTKGGFECSCKEGFSLVNQIFCQSHGSATIYITLDSDFNGEIRSLDLHTKEYMPVISGVEKPVGVGYDLYRNKLFWTDASLGRSLVEHAEISKNGSGVNKKVFLQTGLEHPEDLVLEPHSGLVYFSDSGKGRVAACNMLSSMCTIISEDHSQPRGLALHSNYRFLFVTEWGRVPQIVRMNMDGSSARTVVNTKIMWPNGIAVDETMDRIYWTDAHRDTIESANLDGTDRRLVISDVFHPFGVAVFEDTVYWSDWNDYRLFSCNKFTGKDIKVVLETPNRMNGISIHNSMPVVVSDPCAKASCSHLCIPYGSTVAQGLKNAEYSCKCPEDMYLKSDGVTCESIYFMNHVGIIVVASGNTLYSLKPQKLGTLRLESVGFETGTVTGLSSFILDNVLIATTDVGQVLSVNAYWKTSHLLSVESDTKSIAHDSVQSNLFWIDSVTKSIVIMSEKSKQIKTLIKCTEPKALTYVPSRNIIAFIDGTNLLESSVDGKKTSLLSGILPRSANLLVYSDQLKTYFISAKDRIHSYAVDKAFLGEVTSVDYLPVSLTLQGDYLYWTDQGMQHLSWTNVNRHEVEQSVFKILLSMPGNQEKYISASARMPDIGEGPCAFQSCSDICIRTDEDSAHCVCGNGRSIIKDDLWNKCQDVDFVTEAGDSVDVYQYKKSLIGMGVSLCVVLVLVWCWCCCAVKKRKFKPTEFINRSFGLSPEKKKSTQHQEMSSIQVVQTGLRTEVENPGFTAVNLTTPSSGPIMPPMENPFHASFLSAQQEEPVKTGVLPRIINKIRRFGDPKMCALDWTDAAVSYENLVAAKGCSTPSMKKRLDTIEERDSAYTDNSGSLDCSDECSFGSDQTLLVG